MNRRLASVLSAVAMFAAAAIADPQEADASARIMPSPGCGFVPLPQPVGELTARYFHCADSFILIKFHWSGGNTGTACESPWAQHPFFRSGGQVVVNAYYVPTPPNLIGPPGNQMCSVSQPRV
ncbi:hypothetical protein DFR72_108112 [Lentzea flaviverrucosa]|uniref:Secreted protein n=2 Tax=Lentzea flaviverrucosa TaxID=200379 RepID=A0A1H9SL40_9PSEU|nr:hypothetical protein DFR72_108112 [Lentzea flaviverrucosa]SER85667.1 hypothetical protein SAMN05216195_107113 [Lentzea flaviverrucosa]